MAPSLRALALILATHRALARLGARRTVFDGVRARRGPSTSKVVDVYAVGDRLDRYALALAATEPLRRARDDALKRTVGRRKLFVTRKLLRRNPCEGTAFSASDRTKEACEMYTTTATRVLKSFGFTPSEWNSVSRALASDRNLRNRVLNQAKLYGLASTIETGSLNVDDGAVPKLQIPVPENEDDLVRFAAVARRVGITPSTRRDVHWFISTQVAQKVELLRQKQRAQLVKSLKGVDVFPDYPICDSALLPMMSNQVRRTCASFPAQARELVLKNGVEFETFQALLDKAERNPMYRWKLARAVRKLKRRQRAALEAKKV